MLVEFGSDIWIADGKVVSVAGFQYPTRMAVIRLSDGTLFICSPVAMDNNLKNAVDAIGMVAHIVAPNSLHHLFLPEWIAAYPNAQIHGAPKLAQKRKDITFDSELSDIPAPAWDGQIDQVMMRCAITTEVVFFHRASGTVIFTDLLQQFPKGWHKGWRAIVAHLDLMVCDEPTVPRKFRMSFVNRKAARAKLRKIYDWPAQKVLMAHGTPVETDAPPYLRRAFSWLSPS
ncbi:hypothetical protein GCM10008927_28470 [Amylibacter ulvae]|uniref:DUF4336 domain-containing protein n=1 Tax=Paramylibacter ulvae TaxID=1651968 RepID=A0ABQ3D6G6_9RHOB|nr:DUF4336 domain-containing protein [Amylibacter ulvae]GHA61332.1 hypothetical protein GCM10008927_28470 [Amylibacter ulvae]